MARTALCFLLSVFPFIAAGNSLLASPVTTKASGMLHPEISARVIALGDAFTGMTDDINAIAYNPAGLARLSSSEIAMMYSKQDNNPENYYYFGGLFFRLSDGFNVGLSGNMENTSVAGENSVYTLSYACKVMETKDVGVTTMGFNYRSLSNELTPTDTISSSLLDFGLLSTLFISGKPLGLGLCLQNLGGTVTHSDGSAETDYIPLVGRVGIGFKFGADIVNKPISVMADVISIEKELEPKYSLGFECWFTGGLVLRLGYKVNYAQESITSAGLGFKVGGMRLDYGLASVGQNSGGVSTIPKISFVGRF